MPLQDSSQPSLCIQDLPMTGDFFTSQKTSPSSQSRTLETGSQTTMPSLINRAANFVSDYCYKVKPYDETGSLPLKSLPWQDIHEPSTFKQESNNYHLTHESPKNDFANAFGGSYIEKPADDSLLDYGYIHHSVLPYTSSMRPRNYPIENDIDLREAIQPHTETQTTSSFFVDCQQQPSHQTMVANLRLQRHQDILANRSTSYQIPSVDEPFQSQSSTSSFYSMDPTHFDISPISSPGTVSPGTVSPNTVIDHGASNGPTTFDGEESDEDGNSNSEPYAQLIFRALKSAPGHKMVLKEIYEWFAKNTDKAKTSSSKGWQNSIRHNLSMNGAFKKVDQAPPTEETKKGFIWVLEPTAVEEGVKSTTRYRKINSNRKIGKPYQPAPQRQRSGAKGGKAAKKATKTRRSARFGAPSKLRHVETPGRVAPAVSISNLETDGQLTPDSELARSTNMPYYLPTPPLSTQSSGLDSKSYGYGDVTGCSPHLRDDPLFYEDPDHSNDSLLCYPQFCDSGDSVFNYSLAA